MSAGLKTKKNVAEPGPSGAPIGPARSQHSVSCRRNRPQIFRFGRWSDIERTPAGCREALLQAGWICMASDAAWLEHPAEGYELSDVGARLYINRDTEQMGRRQLCLL